MANYDSLCSFVLPVKKELLLDVYKYIENDDKFILPEYQIDLDTPGIWFYTEETFNIDDLAELIHELICEFSLPPFGFEWANTCSKPHLDAFGGGAVWITKEGFKWLSTNTWLRGHCAKSDLPNRSA